MPGDPHPTIEPVIEQMEASRIPPIDFLSVDGARTLMDEDLHTPPPEPEPVASVREYSIPGSASSLPVRVYTPEGEGPHPIVLYFHGGGFVMGTLDTHDSVARRLTTESRVIVVSVGYRRAPEARFPAACKDCWAALEWVAEVGPSLGGDPDRIGVAGDSAGGNLAIGVGMRSRGNDGPTVAHTALIYPITDFSFSTASYDEYADGYGFNTRATMRWCWDKYLDDDLHGENPYASPLRARDLTGFPPTIMVTAELDPLRDEGLAFASRLEAAGVPVTSRTYDGMIHGFVNMLAAPEIPHASDALELIAEEMAAWL